MKTRLPISTVIIFMPPFPACYCMRFMQQFQLLFPGFSHLLASHLLSAKYLFLSAVNFHQGAGSPPSIKSTTDRNTSSTQGSCSSPVTLRSSSNRSYRFLPIKSYGCRIPINRRSPAIAFPIFGNCSSFCTVFLSGFFILA